MATKRKLGLLPRLFRYGPRAEGSKLSQAMTFLTPTDGALWLLAQGFCLFPLIPNGKLPAVKAWQKVRFDETAIRGHRGNFGVHPGPTGHCVLDIDVKDGKRGDETLVALEKIHGPLPESCLTVVTPTKGVHYYFEGFLPTTVGQLGQGIDTRCMNSFVVAPGSVIDGKSYVIL